MKKGWRRFWILLGVLAVIALVWLYRGYLKAQEMGFFREPVFETVREKLPPLQRPAVLVFSKTNSFIHRQAIPAAKQALQDLAEQQGWSIYLSDSGAIYNPADLARFDVIVWNNVTGAVLLPEQREAMRTWLEQGGGFVGLHAAGDASHEEWPWYVDKVIRANFIGHPLNPQFQQATLYTEQPADAIVASLGATWTHTDEWYSFAASPRAPDLRVLLTIDESTYQPVKQFGISIAMGDDHPLIWKHCVDAGRVLYAAPGHTAETYADPVYRQVLARAIDWAGRIGEAGDPGQGEACGMK